jgi:PTS system N-acetylglucosamine-specific IIC component
LLLRLGQPDLLNIALLGAAGSAIFSHLGLLFAIGVAAGFARDGNGAACLAGITCFLVAREGTQSFLAVPPDVLKGLPDSVIAMASQAYRDQALAKLDVPLGILSGLIGGQLYNRFATFKVPDYLAFFGGRRFVPIVSGLCGIVLAAVVGPGFAPITGAIDALSLSLTRSGEIGLFAYGLLNRLLLITGLHHILNNVAWFLLGDYHGMAGDLRRFFAGDPHAGAFMTGFFPVMMFGLPAACLAMYHEARPERRRAIGGMLASLALTSFLTGVTEPIEFTFMFLAPALYAIHAVLTGVAMALCDAIGMRLGFGFSAGLFDYVLNFGKATHPLLLMLIGPAYGLLYYGLFRFFIRRFDLPTPGRGVEEVAPAGGQDRADQTPRGAQFVAALGGRGNLASVAACTTRLRLTVNDQAAIDEARLKALGARGLIRPSANGLQVVLGPIADSVAAEMQVELSGAGAAVTASMPAPAAQPEIGQKPLPTLPEMLVQALGGAANIRSARRIGGRWRVELKSADAVVGAELDRACGGWAMVAADVAHIVAD